MGLADVSKRLIGLSAESQNRFHCLNEQYVRLRQNINITSTMEASSTTNRSHSS